MLQENVYILWSGEAEAQEPGYSRQIGTKAMYTLRENFKHYSNAMRNRYGYNKSNWRRVIDTKLQEDIKHI